MTQMVCGFVFSELFERVVLIEKDKPEWQRGYFNGIGGKIEDEETPTWAMARECEEETGLIISQWTKFAMMDGPDFTVHFFFTMLESPAYKYPLRQEREKVDWYRVETIDLLPTIPNLKWLIPACVHWEENLSGTKTSMIKILEENK